MSKHIRPANTPWLLPYLTVEDANRSLEFYQQAFGFKPGEVVEEDGKALHCEMKYQDIIFMFAPEGAYGNQAKTPNNGSFVAPITLYLYTDDVDAFYQNALQNGAISVCEPTDMFWGDRMCNVKDLDGYSWSFATYLGENT